MNGMNEEREAGPGEDQPQDGRPVAFCQSCGKPLHRDTVRIVGPAVYCEPCLAARLAGAGSAAGGAAPPAPGFSPSDASAQANWQVPVIVPDQPNPGLAALLGFLPGVGAMYNGQYAKGIVHLIVFAVLISLAHVSGIFGLFIAGWIFYMVIEAHHTAKARRDGTPLPNPFGLNDIGERLGFGRAWATGPGAAAPDVAGVAQDAARAASEAFHAATMPGATMPGTPPPPFSNVPNWGAPADSYASPYPAASQTYGPPYTQQPYPYSSPSSAPFSASVNPVIPAQTNRFPTGALWLIGLGTVFLLSTTGLFHGLFGPALVGFALIGLGVLVFVRRMTDTGLSLASDGTASYRLRVLRALRISIWLMLIGVLFLLDVFHLLTWHRSWPIFLIVLGVMTLLERTTYSAVAAETFGQTAPTYPQGFDPRTHAPTSSTVSSPSDPTSRDEFQQGGD